VKSHQAAKKKDLASEKSRVSKMEASTKSTNEADARATLLKEKNSAVFALQWLPAGHDCLQVSTVQQRAALSLPQDDAVFMKPVVLRNTPEMATVTTGTSNSAKMFARWKLEFEQRMKKNKGSSTDAMTTAPVLANHGASDVELMWPSLVPVQCCVSAGLPSLTQSLKPWFFGCLPSYNYVGVEGDGLGCMRYIYKGAFNYLCADAKTLLKYVRDNALSESSMDNELAKSATLSRMQKALSEATPESIVQMHAGGVQVYHGIVGNNCLLLTPPGHLVVLQPATCESVCGVRRYFLLKSEMCKESLSALASVTAKSAAIDGFVDALVVALRK
jgi:hypothetical protein